MSAPLEDDEDFSLGFDVVELVACPAPADESAAAFPVREVAFRVNAWTPSEIALLIEKFRADESVDDIAVALGRPLYGTQTKIYDLGLRRYSRRPWTEMEDRILIDQYGKTACATLAAMIGRTAAATFARAGGLGLTEGNAPRWTAWEDAQLAAGYRDGIPIVFLAALIGRPPAGVNTRAYNLGLRHKNWNPEWTEEEKALAIELAEQGLSAREVGKAFEDRGFKRRSKASVRPMLKALGFDRSWGRPWMPEEVDALRKVYADGGSLVKLAIRLGRSRTSVSWKAHEQGLAGTHAKAGRGFRQGDDWTEAEIETLRARYGKEKARVTAEALGRPLRSLYNKAHQLGLEANYFRDWTPDEDSAIGIGYAIGLSMTDIAGAVDRDIAVVSKRAIKLGLSFKNRSVAAPRDRVADRPKLTVNEILAMEGQAEALPVIVAPSPKRRGKAPRSTPPEPRRPAEKLKILRGPSTRSQNAREEVDG